MEESPRTFNSSSTEYSLTCSPKDHVSSPPKKKHSMVLNLGNKSSSVFGADQTPTPTRFIRNCEEVGLFQDLQNVNPFEETFRKAVESGKTGTLALQSSRLPVVTDDTLHTPHVFPHIIENDSVCRLEPLHRLQPAKPGEEDRGSGVRPAVKVVRQEADTSQLRPIAPSLRPQTHSDPVKAAAPVSQPVQLILQMPDGRLMQLNATQLDSDKKSDIQGPVDLVKLKARLGNASASGQSERMSSAGEQRLLGKVGQNCEEVRGKRPSSTSNPNNSDDDEETKRRRFLERNRAAAMRCREKRKFWVATLERRAEQMMSTNQQLQLEVGALRAEVAHLKTLLLAHKDCPVTQAMCSNNQVVDGSGSAVYPVDIDSTLIIKPELHIVKSLSTEETAFRQNLKKKLRTVSTKKSVSQSEVDRCNDTEIPKKKRLSLDIETAKKSQCLSGKDSPLVRSDEYFDSTLLQNEPLGLDSFRDANRPVATQVIQVNPNALFRDHSLRLSPPNIEEPLLPISPHTSCIDYS